VEATIHPLIKRDATESTFPVDVVALVYGLLIYSHVIFLLNQSALLSDPDTYWHIATGKWMLAQHGFPRQDVFSHTVLGHPWTNMEWLSQIILFLAYDFLGWRGVILLCGLALSLTFLLLYAYLARRLRATAALGASAVSFVFASIHFLARPHVLALPLFVIWVASLTAASEENRRPSLWLLPLMTLWANLHGGFTLGLALAVGFAVEATVAAAATERRRVAINWGGFCVAALLAGCINPYGYEYVLATYRVFADLGPILNQNGDWRPMNAYAESYQEAILLGVFAMVLIFGVRFGLVRSLMAVVLLHFGLAHIRALPLVALAWPLMAATPLRMQFPFLRPSADPFPLFDGRKDGPLRATIGLAAFVVGVGVVGLAYTKGRSAPEPEATMSPAAAVDFAIKTNLTAGPVLNHFNFGGYLIFRGIKTFIDGRTLPFGRQLVLDYFDARKPGEGSKLEELADAYHVSWTLMIPRTTEALYFDHSPRWRQVYADDIAVIYVRR
jgi:hypothetical protein